MTCKCGSNRIMNLFGHASDCHNWDVPHLKIEGEGYAPRIPHVSSGDEIDISFCLDCGLLQGFKSISDEKLKEILEVEEEEEEESIFEKVFDAVADFFDDD